MRNRPFSLPKMSVAATALLLVVSACSGDDDSVETSNTTSSSAAAATVVSSTAAPQVTSTTTTTTTSTTVPALPVSGIGDTVLVTADDGVYQISAEGDVTLLVAGPIAYAVDDTQAGLLFQVDRGRTGDQQAGRSTIVWWIPRGASRPQELLVPTPGAGQRLSLHDAYATDDGFAVLYVRHEGSTPDVGDMIDRLRRFDVPVRQVTDLHAQGAWEEGFGHVSINGELIAGVWYQQVGSGCFIKDLDGQATDLVPEAASDPTSEDHVGECRLSPDGNQLVFTVERYDASEFEQAVLHVWDLAADTATAEFVVSRSVGTPRDIDLSETSAVATFGDYGSRQTLMFDLNAPEADLVALPIVGRARFIDTPVDISSPVQVGAGPNYYRFGDDGLHRVADGVETQLEAQPVIRAVDDLMGGVVFLHPGIGDPPRDVWWLRAGATEHELLPVTGVWDAALLDGRSMLLVTIDDPQSQYCPKADYIGPPIALHDLTSGDQTFLVCHSEGPDGGRYGPSLGDDELVSVERVEVGGFGTDSRIVFTDLSGSDMTIGTNPVRERCWPCRLSAEISDDGSLLAYTLWPTAFWDIPVVDNDYYSARDAWRTTAETIPVEAAVVDLATGGELWRTTFDPGVMLADFDGRYLVTSSRGFAELWRVPTGFETTGNVIYDTWGIHQPVEVDGGVALIRQTPNLMLRDDGLGVVSFGDPVDNVITVLTELLGPPDLVESQNSPEVDVSVQWDHPFLYLQFTYWDYFDAALQPPEPMPAGPVFHYYLAKSDAFATNAGIAVGDSVGDLKAAYPGLRFGHDCGSTESTFTIDPPDGWPQLAIWGLLSGDPTNDHTTIEYIGAGWDRSPC